MGQRAAELRARASDSVPVSTPHPHVVEVGRLYRVLLAELSDDALRLRPRSLQRARAEHAHLRGPAVGHHRVIHKLPDGVVDLLVPAHTLAALASSIAAASPEQALPSGWVVAAQPFSDTPVLRCRLPAVDPRTVGMDEAARVMIHAIRALLAISRWLAAGGDRLLGDPR